MYTHNNSLLQYRRNAPNRTAEGVSRELSNPNPEPYCNFTKYCGTSRKLRSCHNVILGFINWHGYENLERSSCSKDDDSLQFSISRTLCTDNRNFFRSSSCFCHWSLLFPAFSSALRLLTQIANAFGISTGQQAACFSPLFLPFQHSHAICTYCFSPHHHHHHHPLKVSGL